MVTPTTDIIIDCERFQRVQRMPLSKWCEYFHSPQYGRAIFLTIVAKSIIFSLGTFITLYAASYALSYTAKLIGASNFPRIPPWAKKTILVGGPLLIGILEGVGAKLFFDTAQQAAQENIGIGFIINSLTSIQIRLYHNLCTQQFYTAAGGDRSEDVFAYQIIKGDLPCHTAIRVKDASSVRLLLELANETLTCDQMRTYLNHANEQGETIHSLAAQEKRISSKLATILHELGLPDLVNENSRRKKRG